MSDKPQFDYSNYSRKAQKLLTRKQLELQRLGQRVDGQGADMSDEDYERVLDDLDAGVQEIERLAFAQVVSVPRDWFVHDAPEGLTCKDEDWWDWLRADKLELLRDAAVEARSPESVTGN